MRLFSYCIPVDDGAAPNPFWGICTLTICKPAIRRVAREDDWIVGVGSKNVEGVDYSGKLVYAMKVTKKLSLAEYDEYCKKELPEKIPVVSEYDWRRHLGDCMYDYSSGQLQQRLGVHTEINIERDESGENSLISDHFYYFGDRPIEIPEDLRPIINQGQGHKSTLNENYKYLIEGLGLKPNEL